MGCRWFIVDASSDDTANMVHRKPRMGGEWKPIQGSRVVDNATYRAISRVRMLQTSRMDTPITGAAPSLPPELCLLAFRRAPVIGHIDFPAAEGILASSTIMVRSE